MGLVIDLELRDGRTIHVPVSYFSFSNQVMTLHGRLFFGFRNDSGTYSDRALRFLIRRLWLTKHLNMDTVIGGYDTDPVQLAGGMTLNWLILNVVVAKFY